MRSSRWHPSKTRWHRIKMSASKPWVNAWDRWQTDSNEAASQNQTLDEGVSTHQDYVLSSNIGGNNTNSPGQTRDSLDSTTSHLTTHSTTKWSRPEVLCPEPTTEWACRIRLNNLPWAPDRCFCFHDPKSMDTDSKMTTPMLLFLTRMLYQWYVSIPCFLFCSQTIHLHSLTYFIITGWTANLLVAWITFNILSLFEWIS